MTIDQGAIPDFKGGYLRGVIKNVFLIKSKIVPIFFNPLWNIVQRNTEHSTFQRKNAIYDAIIMQCRFLSTI